MPISKEHNLSKGDKILQEDIEKIKQRVEIFKQLQQINT